MADAFQTPGGELADGAAVQRDVLLAFEYSYNHDDWVFPLADALLGVTAQAATWTPNSADTETRNIWQIVLHMTVWTENIVERMHQRERGEPPGRPAEGSWPALPPVLDENAWQDTQQRLWNAMNGLRSHISDTSIAAMLDTGNAGYSQLADLLCRLIHNAYHIGQITKLRDCMAATPLI
jgi:hypothetical protein